MLTALFDASETYRNATRPAILDSINSVLEFYQVREKDLRVYLNGDAQDARPMYSSPNDHPRSGQYTDFIFNNKLFAIAEITTTEFNSGYGNLGRQINNAPLWCNKGTRTDLVPIFEGRKINVDCNVHFNTRQQAKNFRNRLQRIYDLQGANPWFRAHIHYPVPYEFMLLSSHLQQLSIKSGLSQADENYPDWFLRHCTVPTSILTNAAGENPIFGMKRRIENSEIILEEPTIALTQRNQEILGKYEVSFRYSFYWQELTSWKVNYPLMVNQHPISKDFVNSLLEEPGNPHSLYKTFELHAGDSIKGFDGTKYYYYARYPLHDPWFPPPNYERVEPKVIVNFTVRDVEEKQFLFNIKAIPGMQWNPVILEFILKYHDLITRRGNLVLWMQLYSDDTPVLQRDIELDEEGNLYLLRDPVIENNYRFVLNLDGMLGLLNEQGKRLIIDDDNYRLKVLPEIFPWWNWNSMKQLEHAGPWGSTGIPVPGTEYADPDKGYYDDRVVITLDDLEKAIDSIGALPEFPDTPSFMLDMSLIAR
ncbi:putative virion structural protein [Vibrio phage Aphrodite1]|uniref:Putative virion structural protein n=1 Tax=Vibrio phage Aphrodite1 TaxID=2070057 RepID=A0A2I7QHS5_9CAUD|nr:putative virion structural protein [Vibrio phage Aphrodite1]AUR80939.1 putative virion structural protein [Vibrio phage Aphrodite1]